MFDEAVSGENSIPFVFLFFFYGMAIKKLQGGKKIGVNVGPHLG